ncbi:MAG: class I SAM-dependent methyltransferase [Candidatus Acidiferrales bacterium]
MRDARPSTTALRVAMRRAAHQLYDNPKILDDPIALPILGEKAQEQVRLEGRKIYARASRYVRAFMVVRSRLAEDGLAAAVERGASQYVILGAGLDTFAYRNPYDADRLRVFEVDHPATQKWKRERLAAGRIQIPASVTFAPVDFEKQSLGDGLAAAGLDRRKVTFFSWLGVTPYLTRAAMNSTLEFIAAMPAGSGVVFDFALPRASLNWFGRLAFDAMARRVAKAGEPFQLFFEPTDLANELQRFGFNKIEDWDKDKLNERYFNDRADKLRVGGRLGRMMSAGV